jgi:hypothetical protein
VRQVQAFSVFLARATLAITEERKLRRVDGAIAGEYRGKAEQTWDDVRDRAQTFQQDTDQCARKSDQGSIHSARNRVCPGPNLSALIALFGNRNTVGVRLLI